MLANDKKEIINKFAIHKNDTGSSEVQIAILTARINSVGKHTNANKKDFHSKHGLLSMVSRRRKLLSYLKRSNNEKYTYIIDKLCLKK